MITENVMWLLGAYVAGSAATYYLFLKKNFLDATEATIDTLIDNGFLRVRKKYFPLIKRCHYSGPSSGV